MSTGLALYLALALLMHCVIDWSTASIPTEYVAYSGEGNEFHIGVIFESSTPPSILVTTDEREAVNFTVSIKDPLFERNATVEPGSAVTITLPLPSLTLSSTSNEAETELSRIMGVSIIANTGESISVFVSHGVNSVSPVLPCQPRGEFFENRHQFTYHIFPPTLDEQQLARSILLLVGCQDATRVQVFSTQAPSLPVDLSAQVDHTSSEDNVVTSFLINHMETVAIEVNGDVSSAYIMADHLLSVSLASHCSGRPVDTTCASGYSQIAPSFTWGRSFLVSSREDTTEFVIKTGLSTSTSALITCNNSTHANTFFQELSLNGNEMFAFKVTSKHYCSVGSQQPIQLAQYNHDTEFPLVIPPTEQYSNTFTLPTLLESQDTLREDNRIFATIFASVSDLAKVEGEGSRVVMNGRLLGGWNAIYCRGSAVCGYGMDVELPLQSDVVISHQDPEVALSVLVHGVGAYSFSYAAGFRLNDLTVSIVYLERASYETLEENTRVEVFVVRDGNYSTVTDVLFTTVDSTALGGEDFIAVNTQIQFLPGEKRKIVTIDILDDQLLEVDEMFNISISVRNERGTAVARENSTLTIIDNDSFEVGFEMESYTVDEVTGRVEVVITSPTPYPGSQEVLLVMSTIDGTAEAPEDYLPLNVFLSFMPGTQRVSIALHVFQDLVVESELERFSLTLEVLSAPAERVFFTHSSTTVFIEDKDILLLELVPSSIMIAEGTSAEGEEVSEVTLMVFSMGELDRPVTVFLTTSDETATAGEDYIPVREALTFTTDETSFNVTVEIVGDEVVEGDEVVTAELVVPQGESGVSLRSSRVQINIIDDDSVELMFVEEDTTVQEGARMVQLTIVKTGFNSRDITVKFATLDGDAVGTEDYVRTTGSLVFTPADGSKSVTVVIRDDDVVEYQERFFMALSVSDNEGGVVFTGSRRAAITIANDDYIEVGFTQTVYSVSEGEGRARLMITKTGSNARPLSVAFTTERNTATSPSDYTGQTVIVTFDSDSSTQTVSVEIVDDTLTEMVEMFRVTLLPTIESVILASDRGEATVEITDNDFVVVGFSEVVYTAEEGDISLGVTLGRRGLTSLPVTLHYHTEDGTANGIEDYFPITNASITFSGESTELPAIQLRLRDDSLPERTEQLVIRLMLPSAVDYGLLLENTTATVVILDNDDVTVKFDSLLYRVSEGSGPVTARLVLQGDTSNTVAVRLRTIDQGAVAPDDYTSLATTVVFAAGITEQMVDISIVDDAVLEQPQTFSLELSALTSGVVVDEAATATIVIEDNDMVSVGFKKAFIVTTEDAGTVMATVVLSAPSEVSFSVLVTAHHDSATDVEDYQLDPETVLQFGPGISSAVATAAIIPDTVLEYSEQFFLSLSSTNDTRVTIQPDREMTVIEIVDSSEVTVGFRDVSVAFSESSESVSLEVVLVAGVLQRPVTLLFTTRDGTATAGEDYIEQSSSVIIPAGEKDDIIALTIIDDVIVERNEYFFVELSSVEPFLLISTSSVNVTIQEDDSVMVTFERTSYTASEGDEQVVVMVMMVGSNTLVDVAVNFNTADDSAIGTSIIADYVGVSDLVLIFGPTTVQHEVALSIIDDPALENTESFTASLTATTSRVSFLESQATVSILDNDVVSVEFSQSSYLVIEGEPVIFLILIRTGISYINTTVNITTHPDSATGGEDYVSRVPSVYFEPFQQRQFVPIGILDDQIVEGDESFFALLKSLQRGVELTSDPARITIRDNDFTGLQVGFEAVKYTVSETEGSVAVCLVASSPYPDTLSFLLYTEQRSAQDDVDFVPVRHEVQLQADQLRVCVSVVILDDSIGERIEDFLVVVENVPSNDLVIEGLSVAPTISEICITDNDNISIGFAEASISAPEDSSSALVVKVLKIGMTTTETVSVAFSTEDGTAEIGLDYEPLGGVLVFSETEDERELLVSVIDDRLLEGQEHFFVLLSLLDETEVTLSRDRLRVVIEDDDDAVIEIGFVMDHYVLSESEKQARVCIIKSAPLATAVRVILSSQLVDSDTAAESFVDFIPVTMVLTLVPNGGDSPECIHIPIISDAIALEPEEEFRVQLILVDSVPGVVIGPIASTTVTIVDDDDVLVQFESESYTVNEDAGTLTVCLTKDKITALSVPLLLIAMEATPPSATEGGDFVGGSITALLDTAIIRACVDVAIIDDAVHESTQHFSILMEPSLTHPNLKAGDVPIIEVTILDDDVIKVGGVNSTVDESEGSVDVCLTMDKEAEIPISVDLNFSGNVDSEMVPAQGGIDFDSTPRSLVFPAGETESCFNVDIFPDTVSEDEEQFTVIVTTNNDNVKAPEMDRPVITITDEEGPAVSRMCKALDSIVIEPFPSSNSLTDSYTFHSPCEHTLLTTCDLISAQHLRVTVSFSPSNLDLLGLAIEVNRTTALTVLRDETVDLTNFPDPLFTNGTFSNYPNGISFSTQDESIAVILSDFGILIERSFGTENRVEIEVLGSAVVDLCGLCGTVKGELVFSDRVTEALSIDSTLIEEFAQSWRVSPLELLLGKQGVECGTIRNDSIIGDPLFTVPLNHPSMTPFNLISGATPHLCFEVHGARDTIFNLISDRCTSVNALFTAMTPPSTGNIISTIAIKAVDYRGNCIEIEVSLQLQCMPVIHGSDGQAVTVSRYNIHGVSVRKHRQGVRVAVPNCENTPLVVWILCDDIRNQSMLKFVISRGVNLRPTSHGILGQFWNIPVTVSPMGTTTTIPSLYLLPPSSILTLYPPSSHPRQFLARLFSNTWDRRGTQCYYAGSAQGGPLGELESPQLRDPVIEGKYTDYIMEGLFETQYHYTRFDSRECTAER